MSEHHAFCTLIKLVTVLFIEEILFQKTSACTDSSFFHILSQDNYTAI